MNPLPCPGRILYPAQDVLCGQRPENEELSGPEAKSLLLPVPPVYCLSVNRNIAHRQFTRTTEEWSLSTLRHYLGGKSRDPSWWTWVPSFSCSHGVTELRMEELTRRICPVHSLPPRNGPYCRKNMLFVSTNGIIRTVLDFWVNLLL